MAAKASRGEWASNVSGQLDAPYLGVLRGLMAQTIVECGGYDYPTHGRCDGGFNQGGNWNCCNTTWRLPGSTNYNSVPVQNYASFADGVTATVLTYKQSSYSACLTVMRTQGVSAADVIKAIAYSPWPGGDHDGYYAQMQSALTSFQGNRNYWYGLGIGPQ